MNRKVGKIVRGGFESFENWRNYTNSRKKAHDIRERIVKRKGVAVVDKKLLKIIKEYSLDIFGSADYWPWLATYTELRGRFMEGWVPDDFYTYELIPLLNPRPLAMLSTIKTFDHRLFDGFAIKPLAIRISGQYYDSNQNKIDQAKFKELLNEHGTEVVIKKDGGPSGRGIIFIDPVNVQIEHLPDDFDLVIQPRVEQYEQLNKLYPHSVNTFRVFSYLSPAGNVEIKAVLLRFGVGGSRIDNIMSGGSYLPLKNGVLNSVSYDGLGFETGKAHPDTGFIFEDLKFPFINELLDNCKKAHLKFPYLRFVGWDVCITKGGELKLIEWNARSPTFWRYEAKIGPFWNEKPV